MSDHTKTPWYLERNSFGSQFIYGDEIEKSPSGRSYSRLVCGGDIPTTLTETNAAFIVKAVNSHDALVSALREILSLMATMDGCDCDSCRPVQNAHAALAETIG